MNLFVLFCFFGVAFSVPLKKSGVIENEEDIKTSIGLGDLVGNGHLGDQVSLSMNKNLGGFGSVPNWLNGGKIGFSVIKNVVGNSEAHEPSGLEKDGNIFITVKKEGSVDSIMDEHSHEFHKVSRSKTGGIRSLDNGKNKVVITVNKDVQNGGETEVSDEFQKTNSGRADVSSEAEKDEGVTVTLNKDFLAGDFEKSTRSNAGDVSISIHKVISGSDAEVGASGSGDLSVTVDKEVSKNSETKKEEGIIAVDNAVKSNIKDGVEGNNKINVSITLHKEAVNKGDRVVDVVDQGQEGIIFHRVFTGTGSTAGNSGLTETVGGVYGTSESNKGNFVWNKVVSGTNGVTGPVGESGASNHYWSLSKVIPSGFIGNGGLAGSVGVGGTGGTFGSVGRSGTGGQFWNFDKIFSGTGNNAGNGGVSGSVENGGNGGHFWSAEKVNGNGVVSESGSGFGTNGGSVSGDLSVTVNKVISGTGNVAGNGGLTGSVGMGESSLEGSGSGDLSVTFNKYHSGTGSSAINGGVAGSVELGGTGGVFGGGGGSGTGGQFWSFEKVIPNGSGGGSGSGNVFGTNGIGGSAFGDLSVTANKVISGTSNVVGNGGLTGSVGMGGTSGVFGGVGGSGVGGQFWSFDKLIPIGGATGSGSVHGTNGSGDQSETVNKVISGISNLVGNGGITGPIVLGGGIGGSGSSSQLWNLDKVVSETAGGGEVQGSAGLGGAGGIGGSGLGSHFWSFDKLNSGTGNLAGNQGVTGTVGLNGIGGFGGAGGHVWNLEKVVPGTSSFAGPVGIVGNGGVEESVELGGSGVVGGSGSGSHLWTLDKVITDTGNIAGNGDAGIVENNGVGGSVGLSGSGAVGGGGSGGHFWTLDKLFTDTVNIAGIDRVGESVGIVGTGGVGGSVGLGGSGAVGGIGSGEQFPTFDNLNSGTSNLFGNVGIGGAGSNGGVVESVNVFETSGLSENGSSVTTDKNLLSTDSLIENGGFVGSEQIPTTIGTNGEESPGTVDKDISGSVNISVTPVVIETGVVDAGNEFSTIGIGGLGGSGSSSKSNSTTDKVVNRTDSMGTTITGSGSVLGAGNEFSTIGIVGSRPDDASIVNNGSGNKVGVSGSGVLDKLSIKYDHQPEASITESGQLYASNTVDGNDVDHLFWNLNKVSPGSESPFGSGIWGYQPFTAQKVISSAVITRPVVSGFSKSPGGLFGGYGTGNHFWDIGKVTVPVTGSVVGSGGINSGVHFGIGSGFGAGGVHGSGSLTIDKDFFGSGNIGNGGLSNGGLFGNGNGFGTGEIHGSGSLTIDKDFFGSGNIDSGGLVSNGGLFGIGSGFGSGGISGSGSITIDNDVFSSENIGNGGLFGSEYPPNRFGISDDFEQNFQKPIRVFENNGIYNEDVSTPFAENIFEQHPYNYANKDNFGGFINTGASSIFGNKIPYNADYYSVNDFLNKKPTRKVHNKGVYGYYPIYNPEIYKFNQSPNIKYETSKLPFTPVKETQQITQQEYPKCSITELLKIFPYLYPQILDRFKYPINHNMDYAYPV